jgi:hypothetical protein
MSVENIRKQMKNFDKMTHKQNTTTKAYKKSLKKWKAYC